jgi:hypothetical protein
MGNVCGRTGEFAVLMRPQHKKGATMLWTIFVILLVLWLLGFSFHVAGGLIHILLVVALIVLVINLISGRRSNI